MKNLEKLSSRIKRAVEEGENIVLFGDSDLDGVTSAIILKEAIEKRGGSASVYLSRREDWGHGMTEAAVSFMQNETPALLITLDCGITNFKGIKFAKEEGFDVFIVDHHKTLSQLPEASIILNPKQAGDDYPFKKLANVGIVYKLAEEFLGNSFSEAKDRFLMLASLGTIADMVPKKEDNKEILEEGIPLLLESRELPFSVIREHIAENFIERAVSLLNITNPKGNVNDCFLLLTAEQRKEIEQIIERLETELQERSKEITNSSEEILRKTSDEDVIIFEQGDFLSHFAGSIASRVIKKIKKPIFLCAKTGDVSRGSARVPSGYDAVEAMDKCQNYLEAYGGHPEAAGFVVKNEKLEEFKSCLINYFKKNEKNNNLY